MNSKNIYLSLIICLLSITSYAQNNNQLALEDSPQFDAVKQSTKYLLINNSEQSPKIAMNNKTTLMANSLSKEQTCHKEKKNSNKALKIEKPYLMTDDTLKNEPTVAIRTTIDFF